MQKFHLLLSKKCLLRKSPAIVWLMVKFLHYITSVLLHTIIIHCHLKYLKKFKQDGGATSRPKLKN